MGGTTNRRANDRMMEKWKKYDPVWVRKCMAGPNALLLTEALSESMDLKPDMMVLDLGCGRALSSVFLAREFGAAVYAVDPKTHASETFQMLKDIGMDSKVFPIQAEAAALPIMPGTVDALVCINAYHNFGMEPSFFGEHLRPLLKPSAQVGLVLLATDAAYVAEDDLQENEQPAFWSAANWRRWFSRDLDIQVCEQLSCTSQAWQDWLAASNPAMEEGEQLSAKLNPRLALVKIVGTAKA